MPSPAPESLSPHRSGHEQGSPHELLSGRRFLPSPQFIFKLPPALWRAPHYAPTSRRAWVILSRPLTPASAGDRCARFVGELNYRVAEGSHLNSYGLRRMRPLGSLALLLRGTRALNTARSEHGQVCSEEENVCRDDS